MVASGQTWMVIVAAVIAANMPFFSQRALGVLILSKPKSLMFRVLELSVSYALVGGLGFALEARAGQMVSQSWEFFVVTGFLFLTLAFPGFVYRYLFVRSA